VSSPDSSSNDSPRDGSGGQDEVDPLEIAVRSAQILQALTALVDSNNAQRESNESRFAVIEGGLSGVVRAVGELTRVLQHAIASPPSPASATEQIPRQLLQIERSMLWAWEVRYDKPPNPRLPRSSIIGRALYDLQHEAASGYEGSVPADIYLTISARGPHHLSETAQRYVTRYRAGETSDASGKMGIHLKPRFEALAKPTDRPPYAEQTGELRYLTGHGVAIFSNWPNWDARDDDLTGYGPSTSGSAPPARGTGAT
jgi:hypothetical protein